MQKTGLQKTVIGEVFEEIKQLDQQLDLLNLDEEIRALAVKANRCPYCVNHPYLVSKEAELVCPSCGWVVGDAVNVEETIPIQSGEVASGHAEGNFQPSSESSDGHGLGSDTQKRRQGHSASRLSYAVLSKFVDKPTVVTCRKCGFKQEVNDLPLRAQHLTTITEQYEHPRMKTVLRWGRIVLKELGYDQNINSTFVLKNQAGLIERTVTQKLIDRNVRVNFRDVAEACVLLAVQVAFGEERFKLAYSRLMPDDLVLKDVARLWSLHKGNGGE